LLANGFIGLLLAGGYVIECHQNKVFESLPSFRGGGFDSCMKVNRKFYVQGDVSIVPRVHRDRIY